MVEHLGMLNHLWAKVVDLGMTARTTAGADRTARLRHLGVADARAAAGRRPGRVVVPTTPPTTRGRSPGVVQAAPGHRVELVPTMVRLMLDDVAGAQPSGLGGLRWLLATGEELPTEVAGRWLRMLPHAGLLNAYGPTECSDDVTHHRVDPADLDGARLPIGAPVGNAVLYVLRRDDESGPGLPASRARSASCLSAARWSVGATSATRTARRATLLRRHARPTPTAAVPDRRRGPAAADRPVLEYLGRVDRQVKVAGVRMELPRDRGGAAARSRRRRRGRRRPRLRLTAHRPPPRESASPGTTGSMPRTSARPDHQKRAPHHGSPVPPALRGSCPMPVSPPTYHSIARRRRCRASSGSAATSTRRRVHPDEAPARHRTSSGARTSGVNCGRAPSSRRPPRAPSGWHWRCRRH